MPSVSQSQQRLMAACEHGAGWASCPKMTHQQLHDFAATPRTGLPVHVRKKMQFGGLAMPNPGGIPTGFFGKPDPITPRGFLGTPAVVPPAPPFIPKGPQTFDAPILQNPMADPNLASKSMFNPIPNPTGQPGYLGGPGFMGVPPVTKFTFGGVSKDYTRGGVAKLGKFNPLPPSYGSDTIPAALTPNEVVLNEKQQKAVAPIPGKEHLLKPEILNRLKAQEGYAMPQGVMPPPGSPPPQSVVAQGPQQGQLYYPKSDADFDKIPLGGSFIDPQDGKTYIKKSERQQNTRTDKAYQYPFA